MLSPDCTAFDPASHATSDFIILLDGCSGTLAAPAYSPFWVGFIATQIATFLSIVGSNQLVQGASPTHPLERLLYTQIPVFGIGLASSSARIHSVLAVSTLPDFVFLLILLDEPAALFQ